MIDCKTLNILSNWAEEVELGIISLDLEGIIKLINKSAALILGVSTDDVLGKPLQSLPFSKNISEFFLTALRQNITQQFNFNGRNIRMVGAPAKSRGQVLGNFVIMQDRTEVTNILEQLEILKKNNYYLEQTLNAAFEDVVIVDKEGKLVFVAQNTAFKMGVEPTKIIGLPATELDPDCILKSVVETGRCKVGEIWKFRNHAIPSIIVPIYNREREIEGAVWKSIFRDMEEAREFVRKYSQGGTKRPTGRNYLKKVTGVKFTFEDIIGYSPVMKKTKEAARRAAKIDSTVLLLGESGTGKELFAQAIHAASSRRNGPFVKVNCAAIPESLLETELFGYEEGAFSGARKGGKPGKFELAHGGTIFLDEIGDMGLNMQAKLLRVLQEREIERVGGVDSLEVDVRVIAATNQDIQEKVKKKTFRDDLFYRLNVITLTLPPLRERMEDLPVLINYLLSKLNFRLGTNILGVSEVVMGIFQSYSWPGNVRELENILEGAICLGGEELITMDNLPLHFRRRALEIENISTPATCLEATLEDIEKKAIQKALKATNGNRKQAAILLGIPRSSFYYKIKQYGIN